MLMMVAICDDTAGMTGGPTPFRRGDETREIHKKGQRAEFRILRNLQGRFPPRTDSYSDTEQDNTMERKEEIKVHRLNDEISDTLATFQGTASSSPHRNPSTSS